VKFYQAIFFSWAENAKLVGHAKNWTEPARKLRQAGQPGLTGPGDPSGGLPPRFPLGRTFLTFFFGQKNLRKSRKGK
jgi:hypothetical protein